MLSTGNVENPAYNRNITPWLGLQQSKTTERGRSYGAFLHPESLISSSLMNGPGKDMTVTESPVGFLRKRGIG